MTELITLTDPRSAAAEAYRSLRTNLALNRPGEAPRSLLVVGPTPTEDRAAVAANLAVASAHAGHAVILVDADLHRPSQHALFALENRLGLADALASAAGADALLQDTAVPGLRVLTAGTPPANPASLLDGPRTADLLARLRAMGDLLIVDAPPILSVSDAAVLAPLLDGVLLVVTAGRTRREAARAAREALDRVGANVLGVVLTEADAATVHDRY